MTTREKIVSNKLINQRLTRDVRTEYLIPNGNSIAFKNNYFMVTPGNIKREIFNLEYTDTKTLLNIGNFSLEVNQNDYIFNINTLKIQRNIISFGNQTNQINDLKSIIFFAGSKVGVFTINPQHEFSVSGNAKITQGISTNSIDQTGIRTNSMVVRGDIHVDGIISGFNFDNIEGTFELHQGGTGNTSFSNSSNFLTVSGNKIVTSSYNHSHFSLYNHQHDDHYMTRNHYNSRVNDSKAISSTNDHYYSNTYIQDVINNRNLNDGDVKESLHSKHAKNATHATTAKVADYYNGYNDTNTTAQIGQYTHNKPSNDYLGSEHQVSAKSNGNTFTVFSGFSAAYSYFTYNNNPTLLCWKGEVRFSSLRSPENYFTISLADHKHPYIHVEGKGLIIPPFPSDSSLKENITPANCEDIEQILDIFRKIKPVTYEMIETAKLQAISDRDTEFIGIIAQDLQEINPSLVKEEVRSLSDGTKMSMLIPNYNLLDSYVFIATCHLLREVEKL